MPAGGVKEWVGDVPAPFASFLRAWRDGYRSFRAVMCAAAA